jgi:PadR family transcriptional regulator PadR
MNGQALREGESRVEPDDPAETAPSRRRILDYLASQGGAIESPTGRGLTKQMAQAVGYTELSALNAMLARLEAEGFISRDVSGRRTYRITLMPATASRGGKARAASRASSRAQAVEEELRHPRGHLKAAVLLLLEQRPDHGYELVARLRPFGYEQDDPARTYRALHWLENAGLVEPRWETSGAGPARRVYEITAEGRRMAARVSDVLRERSRAFEEQLSLAGERRLRLVPGDSRSFEVLVEAKLAVQAQDEGSAREAAEQALAANRTIDDDVQATGQVWVYDVRSQEQR